MNKRYWKLYTWSTVYDDYTQTEFGDYDLETVLDEAEISIQDGQNVRIESSFPNPLDED